MAKCQSRRQRVSLRRCQAKRRASLDIFPESENVEIEHNLPFVGHIHWAKSCWRGKWAEDMAEAWKRQTFEAGRRHMKSHP